MIYSKEKKYSLWSCPTSQNNMDSLLYGYFFNVENKTLNNQKQRYI